MKCALYSSPPSGLCWPPRPHRLHFRVGSRIPIVDQELITNRPAMSWLAKSLATSLNMSDHRGGATDEERSGEGNRPPEIGPSPRGVKDDISEIKQTLSRQFWGVASFLAPAPASSPDSSAPDCSEREESDLLEPTGISGIRGDLAEISGRFRSGISRLSGNKAVSEISKIASTFLPFGSDMADDGDEEYGEDAGPIGITEEVLAFARNISMHPETWLDFPLFVDDEEPDDFDMSDAQQDHALAIEHLAPRLAALRIELCPTHMAEACFWKIYFVLLYSRLSKQDAELLSTPQIVEARSKWLQELQKQTKPEQFMHKHDLRLPRKEACISTLPEDLLSPSSGVWSSPSISPKFKGIGTSELTIMDSVVDKHPLEVTEVEIVYKAIVEEGLRFFVPRSEVKSKNNHDSDEDEWLHEDCGEISQLVVGQEEDVSFSDLEEDYDDIQK